MMHNIKYLLDTQIRSLLKSLKVQYKFYMWFVPPTTSLFYPCSKNLKCEILVSLNLKCLALCKQELKFKIEQKTAIAASEENEDLQ